MITIVATLVCKPGTEEEVERASLDWFIPKTLEEEGCDEFLLLRQQDDPTRFVSYEIFRDKAALDAHIASDHVKQFFEFMTDKEVQNAFKLYDALPSAGRETS